MARKGAMAKNPPLRGQARRDFKAARQSMAGQPVPQMPSTQVLQPPPPPLPQTMQPSQAPQERRQMPNPNSQEYQQMLQGYMQRQAGIPQPMDKMFRYPQPQQIQPTVSAITGEPSSINGGMSEAQPGNFGDMPLAKGQIQDGMFRSPGVPMQNIPGMAMRPIVPMQRKG